MAGLTVNVIANIGGKKIPLEELSREKRIEMAMKLNDDAMRAAGYEKCSGPKLEARPEHIISA